MSTQYWMTYRLPGWDGYWEPCLATSLTAAKRECSQRFRGGYIGATLMVGDGDNVTEPRRVLATRQMTGRWRDSV